jgi:sugar lactone lactonase YvrE
MVTRRLRIGIAAGATLFALAACIELTRENLVAAPPQPAGGASVTPWRTVNGGFISAPSPQTGVPVRPGVGAFVRLVAPGAVAVRGNDVLIVDSGAGRIFRYDLALNALITIAGAPATSETRVALGPDLSAYVLDTTARQVLRFGRDGRLLQTFRTDAAWAPADFALGADNVSLQLIDRTTMQVILLTQVGASVLPLRLLRADDLPTGPLAGIAVGRAGTYLLDANAGVVYLMDRDGRVVRTLGRGELALPGAIAVDRFERVYVTEPAARTIKVLRDGAVTQTLTAAGLRLGGIGGVGTADGVLVVSDPENGQVGLFTLRAEAAR